MGDFEKLGRLIGNLGFYREKSRLVKFANRVAKKSVKLAGIGPEYCETILKLSVLESGRTTVAISFDCDLVEDIKSYSWVAGKFKEYGLKGSFACVGLYIEKYPDEHKMLVEGGHEIMNHTYSHPNHFSLSPDRFLNKLAVKELSEEILKADECIKRVLDYDPCGFRTPHFGNLHTHRVYPILRGLGYKYSSSTIASQMPQGGKVFTVDGILEIPLSPSLRNPFMCPETWGLYRSPKPCYRNEQEYLSELDWLFDRACEYNSFVNLYFDPGDLKRLGKGADHLLGRLRELKEKHGAVVGPYAEVLECEGKRLKAR